MIACVGPGEASSCRPVLDLLAGAGWREGPLGGAVLEEEKPLVLGGREVEVEEGCVGENVTNGGRIQCGKGAFALWVHVGDEATARRAVEAFLAEAGGKLESIGGVRSEVPCQVAGVPATCIRIRGEEDGRPFVLAVARADVEGWLFASCLTQGRSLAGRPCRSVFEE